MLDELLDGWIERKDGYFVTAFLDSSLKWEEKIDIEEVPFIAYLVKSLGLTKYYTVEEAIKLKAFAFGKSILGSVGISTVKHKLKLNDKTHDSYTDGQQIVVSTVPLNCEETEEYNGYDVFIGLILHEASHVLFTDFAMYVEHMKSLDLPKGAMQLFKTLVNIVEDERIERALLDRYPGNGNFIARLKEYYFRRTETKELDDNENIEEFIGLLLQVIRYPKYVNELLFERYEDLLFSVKDILLDYPQEMGEMLDKTTELFNLLLEYFGLSYEHKEDDEKLEEIVKGVKDSYGEAVSTIDTEIDSKEEKLGRHRISDEKTHVEKILDGEVGKTKNGFHLRAEKGTKEAYLRELEPMKHLLPGFRHFLAYNTYTKTGNIVGLKEGKLDTTKLVEGVQGVQTIYYRTMKPELKKLTLALLVDMSGSMGETKMRIARQSTILLTEVLSKNKTVDLYVYGYTGQDITARNAELYEYYTPKNPNKYSIANMRAISQNLDGYSLLQLQEQIRRDTNEDVLVFMVSDGEPAASGYSGESAERHLKECVQKLEKDKFKIIHLAVGYKGLPDVYKNIVFVKDVKDLSRDLYLSVKKTLRKKT